MVKAYLGTLLPVLFLPWRAGARVALPDRWHRAIRWAGAHLCVAMIAATLLGSEQYFPFLFAEWLRPSPFYHPALFLLEHVPGERVLTWLAQSLLAWGIVLAAVPVLGVLLSLGMPGAHRAAKLAAAKWSLYVAPVMLAPLAIWYGFYHVLTPMLQFSTVLYRPPAPPVSPWVLACVYATCWAAGLAGTPYNRSHWSRWFSLSVLLYIGIWFAVTRLLFAAGPLETLL